MINLFEEINKLTDDELRFQIALFEKATITNAVKETGFRFVSGIKELANAFTESLGGKALLEYDVKRVSDMVKESAMELKIRDRESLLKQLKQLVVNTAKEMSSTEISDEESEIRLTKIVVDEAAKVFSIEKYKPVGNKIDEIIIEYNNAFLKTLHSQLIKEDAKQAAVTDKQIQRRMDAVSMDTKRVLWQQIRPKEFNGTGVGRVLRTEKGTKNLKDVLTFLGKETFDFAQAEVWTILLTMKGLKRPNRMQLARLIWVVGEKKNAKYAFSVEQLPGYIGLDQRVEFEQSENEFKNMMLLQNQRIKKLEQSGQKLEKQKELCVRDEERLSDCAQRLEALKQKFSELKNKKEEFYQGGKSEGENKAYYASVNETKRNLDQTENEFNKLKDKLKKQELKMEEIKNENDNLQKTFDAAKVFLVEAAGQRIKKLKSSWNTYFNGFEFSDAAVSFVAINLTRDEQLCVECRLRELHETDNPEDYKDEQSDDVIKIFCFVGKSKNVVIELKGNIISNISKKD